MDIIEELEWRGAINQQTDAAGLKKLLKEKKIGVYCGTDPTGDSLHVGHLIPFIVLKRFELAGYHPYILIGGGTGAIGDPSGKNAERKLQTPEQVKHNVDALTAQTTKLFGGDGHITFVNNYDWLSQMDLLGFLRDYGKQFSVNTMIHKEVVANRLEVGISFTEFTYQILQAVDFLTLYREHGVQLQVGGADQWGNITAGIDLIHREEGQDAEAYGLTIPLMVKADGTKFGKTAGGAVWLDPEKTSPYEFYQFWLNQDDRDVVKYLKYFTFLSKEEIDELAKQVEEEPWKRAAQKALAAAVTTFVHGEEATKEAQKISQILFSGNVQELTTAQVEQAFGKMPSVAVTADPMNIVDWLVEYGIEQSKRRAREDVTNGAITVNGERIRDVEYVLDPKSAFDGKYVVLRKGKRKYTLAKVK
ncbi:tyrosine--tRNA ligase [Ligilactobacillus hohenheimensis]|uniref:tyrosine--tRNA ligase n=1 Tax=Ligilactobacillus hohenheimensis TaxID=2991832 RepID=UPI0024BB88AC|nr:tyrosine--tRNA ligase [Ligilactobacillus hohenheimensis]